MQGNIVGKLLNRTYM